MQQPPGPYPQYPQQQPDPKDQPWSEHQIPNPGQQPQWHQNQWQTPPQTYWQQASQYQGQQGPPQYQAPYWQNASPYPLGQRPAPKKSTTWVIGLVTTIASFFGLVVSIMLMVIGIGWCMVPFALMGLILGICLLIFG